MTVPVRLIRRTKAGNTLELIVGRFPLEYSPITDTLNEQILGIDSAELKAFPD